MPVSIASRPVQPDTQIVGGSTDFPKTIDSRVYHLGIKAGELASLIITVGDPARARIIAKYLDSPPSSAAISNFEEDASDAHIVQPENSDPSLFELYSDRGFLTLTGTYKGVRVSIVSIGMGAPNMDFFVREGREVLDEAGEEEMVVIRFGSCGGLVSTLPVGSLVVPKISLGVTRNYDFDFLSVASANTSQYAYRISKPVHADEELNNLLVNTLKECLPSDTIIDDGHMNASADSFYASQGRITSFPDHNVGLIDHLVKNGVGSLEMETFHLFHLATCWPRPEHSDIQDTADHIPPPPTGMPAASLVTPSYTQPERIAGALTLVVPDGTEEDPEPEETILYPVSTTRSRQDSHVNSAQATPPPELADPVPPILPSPTPASRRRIRAAAVQMIFAERTSRAFISPEQVETLQEGAAKALLETLIKWRQPKGTEAPSEAE